MQASQVAQVSKVSQVVSWFRLSNISLFLNCLYYKPVLDKNKFGNIDSSIGKFYAKIDSEISGKLRSPLEKGELKGDRRS